MQWSSSPQLVATAPLPTVAMVEWGRRLLTVSVFVPLAVFCLLDDVRSAALIWLVSLGACYELIFTVIPNAVKAAAPAAEASDAANTRVPVVAQLTALVVSALVLATGYSKQFAALTEAVVMAGVALITVVYMLGLRVTAPASNKATGKPWSFDAPALIALLMLLTAPALLSWPLSFAIRVRTLPNGMAWQLITGGAIWTADTGALILGSALGGPKMMPAVSPGKTVAGFVGSFVGAACVVYGFVWYDAGATLPLSEVTCIALTVGLGGFAVVGDLLESSMKRAGQVKDSGGMLPGQGGLLDRMDSAVFAAPFIYFGVLHGLLGA